MEEVGKYIILSLALCFSALVYGQIDGSSGGNKKGSFTLGNMSISAKEAKKPKSLDFKNDHGFKTAHNKQQQERKKKQEEEAYLNKGILTKAKIAEEQYLNSFQKINGQYQYPVIDQDLGSFSTKSKSVNIICRDFQYPDGDQVTILVNDIPVITRLTLQQRYQSFNIPLEKGVNTIQIIALNQGTSGPNTAAFKIYNDAGMLISSNQWNLATGAKASIIIAKEK
ncbi:hypothetical protein SAMN04489761_0104 [Tenacibaculum sp. MAR_2009_124]|uniref:hypothetical protein n=1 Tax=Tenacibaculum sp. MAR_2009_124 TaxID=1250059 RepID=UPI000899F3A3|nr:hypothetical protein [Tenacibaculum sp. MAR_2009_124]SEB35912.1 hypothetical protein SAMN04489761_0104 [Tenacibaculum sp. MAR_2009_124]